MNAEGVMNSDRFTSIRSEFRTCNNYRMSQFKQRVCNRKIKDEQDLAYDIENLQVLVLLLDQKLLIELLDEVDLLVTV